MTAVDKLEAELKALREAENFEPTLAGNTGMVYSKKARAAKIEREKKAKAAMKAWNKGKDVKIKALKNFGALHIGHPQEATYGGQEGQIVVVKEADAKEMERCGYAERV